MKWLTWLQDKIWYYYCVIWFWTQFWVDKQMRRPFTYSMRDFIYKFPYLAWPLIGGLFYGAYRLSEWHLIAGFFVSGFLWVLLTHLLWAKYEPGQQEWPPVILS